MQQGIVNAVNPRVDLSNLALGIAGIFMLNNADDLAIVTLDTAIAGRVGQINSDHGNAIHRRRLQTAQGFRAYQRHIAVQNQTLTIAGQDRQGHLHRMACAELFGLLNPVNRLTGKGLLYLLAAMTVDGNHPCGL